MPSLTFLRQGLTKLPRLAVYSLCSQSPELITLMSQSPTQLRLRVYTIRSNSDLFKTILPKHFTNPSISPPLLSDPPLTVPRTCLYYAWRTLIMLYVSFIEVHVQFSFFVICGNLPKTILGTMDEVPHMDCIFLQDDIRQVLVKAFSKTLPSIYKLLS